MITFANIVVYLIWFTCHVRRRMYSELHLHPKCMVTWRPVPVIPPQRMTMMMTMMKMKHCM
jgi:hypothetical protein